jgi:ABC-2 type transport system permease protein
MTVALSHSWFMTVRWLRALWRQPIWIAVGLAQPVIWLVLFGQLFKSIVDLPGFGAQSYVDYLTPAVVIMGALFGGAWNGMAMIDDLKRGVLDRFLVSPASRFALVTGLIAQAAVIAIVQAVILVVLGLILGAQFPGGVPGVLVLLLCTALLTAAFGALSNALALVTRQEETMIAGVQFVSLPLVFLSSGFMSFQVAPGWISDVGAFNPVQWALLAGRGALGADPDWGVVLSRLGFLALFTAVCAWIATRAFRAYQRSV